MQLEAYQTKALENGNRDEKSKQSTLYALPKRKGYSCCTPSGCTIAGFFDPKYLSWHRVQAQNKNLHWDFSALCRRQYTNCTTAVFSSPLSTASKYAGHAVTGALTLL